MSAGALPLEPFVDHAFGRLLQPWIERCIDAEIDRRRADQPFQFALDRIDKIILAGRRFGRDREYSRMRPRLGRTRLV